MNPQTIGLFLVTALAARGADMPAVAPKTVDVPYRLTALNHIIVRAKINGKGPFNFLIDTGAPALYVGMATCKKLGIAPEASGWGTFQRFEIEGGAVLTRIRGRAEDVFQLEGMNGLGFAGVELHGIIGYNVLARFRMEIDFTKDKMRWTELDFKPKVQGGGRQGGGAVEVVATIMKVLGTMLGKKPAPELVPRGSLGIELQDGTEFPVVKSVLGNGPAAKAGVEVGDRISQVQGRSVNNSEDVLRLGKKIRAGDTVTLTIQRGSASREIRIQAGEGF